jgi:hypothetical protein
MTRDQATPYELHKGVHVNTRVHNGLKLDTEVEHQELTETRLKGISSSFVFFI